MEGALLLDVVIGESSSVLQLLASEDQPLLVGGDSLLILRPEILLCGPKKEYCEVEPT